MRLYNAPKKCCMIVLWMSLFLLTLVVPVSADEVSKPSSADILRGLGYEATPEGLTQALASKTSMAQVMALKILLEYQNDQHLETAVKLLNSTDIKVQVETAKLLTLFNRSEGTAWLEKWKSVEIDQYTISADSAHAILDAAATLAQTGDESLARFITPLLQHKYWIVRFHAARALGDFCQTELPELEKAWMTSVDVAIDALLVDSTREDFVELYLTWVMHSLFLQENVTPAMIDKFGQLAGFDHPVTRRVVATKILEYESGESDDTLDYNPDGDN